MAAYDNVGRIHKQAFLVCCSAFDDTFPEADDNPKVANVVLFVLCLIVTSVRFYIRICVQQQLSVDDGILLFGILCLISAMAILLTIVDKLYVVGAIENGVPVDQLPSNFIDQAFDCQKFIDIALILSWLSMVSVKYSYLFLFKKLISRVWPMIIVWWFAAVFNGLVPAYGVSIYILICPTFYNLNTGMILAHPNMKRCIGEI
jgi:hypothetical protein